MTGAEDTAIRLLADSVNGLRDEVTNGRAEVNALRIDVDGRLRRLEVSDAVRVREEVIASKVDTRRVTRRDIYVPVVVMNLLGGLIGFGLAQL